MELLTARRSDDLSALLERINVRSVVYCLSDLGAPWGFRVDGSTAAKFHLVLDGQATLTLDDPHGTRVTLAAGELVLLAPSCCCDPKGLVTLRARPRSWRRSPTCSRPRSCAGTCPDWMT